MFVSIHTFFLFQILHRFVHTLTHISYLVNIKHNKNLEVRPTCQNLLLFKLDKRILFLRSDKWESSKNICANLEKDTTTLKLPSAIKQRTRIKKKIIILNITSLWGMGINNKLCFISVGDWYTGDGYRKYMSKPLIGVHYWSDLLKYSLAPISLNSV
jgi:hypothetical protein